MCMRILKNEFIAKNYFGGNKSIVRIIKGLK